MNNLEVIDIVEISVQYILVGGNISKMGFFNFFKDETAEDYFGKVISFTLDNISKRDLANCKNGDYVNLWTKSDMDKVMIYAPNSVGGSEQLGIVPGKYAKIIKAHILGQKDYGFSGPSTNNYDASITNVSGSRCTIEIKLYSAKEHGRIIQNMINRDRAATKADLNKKYKMTKPVEIKFDFKMTSVTDFKSLKLKVFEKEFYIEYPYDFKLQLIDGNNRIVAETVSQKEKVARIVKAFYSGQRISITKIEKERDYLKTTISGE